MRKEKIFWQCCNPRCNYIITDLQYQSARFNFPCPRCESPKLQIIKNEYWDIGTISKISNFRVKRIYGDK